MPAQAFPVSWQSAVQFDAIGTGDRQAWLYDSKDDDRGVRTEYGITTGQEYLLSNNSGPYTVVQGQPRSARISWAILCVDYPVGDDCSGRLS